MDYISKGKARVRYEFACKVSVATTLDEGFVVGMRSFPGAPYNGHPSREWTEHGGHAARFLIATVSRPSRTAALVTATRWAPFGDHRILLHFPMRALAMSSTDPSARDDEMGSPLWYRRP